MKCEPTQTPETVDVSALRERYRRECDRRLPSDLRERWGLDAIEGRDGLSLDDHRRDGHRTRVHSSIRAGFDQQVDHIDIIITKALQRGATMEGLLLEP